MSEALPPGPNPINPLPEASWFWRRLFTFMFSLIFCAFIAYSLRALWDLKDARSIYDLARYLLLALVILLTYYMVAPSAEEIVKFVQASKTSRIIHGNSNEDGK